MEHFDVLSNYDIIKIVIYAMVLCSFLVPIFHNLGLRDAVINYKKGTVRKIIPWVILCVLVSNIGNLGCQLYQYPWSVEPQPSQASMYRQIRSMCEYPIWGFANDYQLPILSTLAGVVLWVCWTVYAFSFCPSATSWWKKVCKVIAYFLLSATILGFYVHELKDFLVYGVILLVVFILLKVAHVRKPKKNVNKHMIEDQGGEANNDASQPDKENSYKESPDRFMPPTLSYEVKQDETITESNEAIAIANYASVSNDDNNIDKEAKNTEDTSSESTDITDTNRSKGYNETMMYCKYCGKRINVDSVYCRYCGRKL